MVRPLRRAIGSLAVLAATAGHGAQFAYEPVGLGWSAEEVERVAAAQMAALTERASQEEKLGCSSHCDRLARVFARLIGQARLQTARSATLPWTLSVVRLPDIEALAMSGGQVVISEAFVDDRLRSDEELAFVLAHEMAHSILEHERQALTFARLLLPRQITRSVQDMYAEIDSNLSLFRAMEPVIQQGEYEADELGLLLASAAGYAPERQLAFLQQECTDDMKATLVATHPSACLRLKALQERLPLAARYRAVTLPEVAASPVP
jgi:Zn-dependent protease with chaperone function